MVFAAGEEISWGQRIFGFATPEFLLPLNQQQEFNVHNISYATFDGIYRNGAFLLCLASSAAFFCRKDRLLGMPLPSILLTLGFLLILSYTSGEGLREGLLYFIVAREKGLLLLLLIFALFSRKVELAVAVAATLALVFALSYVNYYNVYHRSIAEWARINETREYLFGLGCLFYALELALAQAPGRLAAIAPASLRGRQLPSWLIPGWLMTGSLVIAGSIALIVFQYFNPITAAREAAARAEYAAVVSGEPIARSDFDLYLRDNALFYVKEPCAPADTEETFFLHLYPVDWNDLPAHREQYGFDNRDFRFFDWRGGVFDGKCLVALALPEYPISRIRTGQYVSTGDGTNELWEGEFRTGPYAPVESGFSEHLAALVGDRQPVLSAEFDVYLVKNRLIYAKEPCQPADLEARFFALLTPFEVKDLPEPRQQYGVENLDFTFDQYGNTFGDLCLVALPLPEYAVTSIYVGQYVPVEEGFEHTWEGEIRLAK